MTEKKDKFAPRKKFSAGEVIFKEGDPKGDAYVLVSGKVKISQNQNGHDITLAVLGPNSIFGDMSLIDDHPRSATVETMEECECIVISIGDFDNKLKTLDPFMQSIFQIMVGRLREMTKKYSSSN